MPAARGATGRTPVVLGDVRLHPDLHGYLSAGKGFETPTQAEMAYAPVAANAPDVFNFGLKPATSSQYEAGLKARLRGNTRVNAAIFQIRTEDEIVVASSLGGRTSYQNAGKTLRRGFELGLESELSEHWNANLAYTRLSATYDSDFQGRRQGHRQGQAPAGRAGKQPVRRTGMEARGGHQHGLGRHVPQPGLRRGQQQRKRPRRAMRYSTGAPASNSAWGPGPSTSWCAWTTCSTASTSARSSSATATGVTTKRPPGCPGTREPGLNTSSEVPDALVRATRPALVSVVNSDYCMDVQ